MKVYSYSKCSTCRKALKLLDSLSVTYVNLPIVETPPKRSELKTMLKYLKAQGGSIKNLMNTSGTQYRELGMAQKLKDGLSETEALKILAGNGKLIKRPFILSSTGGTVGFDEEKIKRLFKG